MDCISRIFDYFIRNTPEARGGGEYELIRENDRGWGYQSLESNTHTHIFIKYSYKL